VGRTISILKKILGDENPPKKKKETNLRGFWVRCGGERRVLVSVRMALKNAGGLKAVQRTVVDLPFRARGGKRQRGVGLWISPQLDTGDNGLEGDR